MNIHENTALLDAFADGELTAAEMAEVQAHLETCPDCRAYVDDVLAMRAAFPTEDDLPLPADFTDKVMAAVANAPQSRPKKQPWGKLLTAAACLAIIVLVQRVGPGVAETMDTAAYSTADCAFEENVSVERSMDAPAETEAEEAPAALYDCAEVYATCGTTAAENGDVSSAAQNAAPTETVGESADDETIPTVWIAASALGDLLAEQEPEETEADCVRYRLTRAEFDALAARLAEQDILLADDSGSEQLLLVVVTD